LGASFCPPIPDVREVAFASLTFFQSRPAGKNLSRLSLEPPPRAASFDNGRVFPPFNLFLRYVNPVVHPPSPDNQAIFLLAPPLAADVFLNEMGPPPPNLCGTFFPPGGLRLLNKSFLLWQLLPSKRRVCFLAEKTRKPPVRLLEVEEIENPISLRLK